MRPTAPATSANGRGAAAGEFARCRFGRQSQHRLEQSVSGIPDGELGGVDTDCEAADPGRDVVPGERPLSALVQLPIGGERERMGGNDLAGEQVGAELVE